MRMTTVAIIPARGGSRRVPRKNVRDFHGRPMIAWPIAAALESGLFDRIVVSTDDDEIAAAATTAGAEVPFRRPADLADDHAPTLPVIAHAIEELGLPIDDDTAVCCLYPATPLVLPDDLRAGAALLAERGGFAVAAYAPPIPIARAFAPDAEGRARWLLPDHARTRTQDLPRIFLDAGWFYWGSTASWTTADSIVDGATILEIPADRALDIDTEADWQRAAALASDSNHGEAGAR